MIKFSDDYITKWENKIVYMPNGGGKSTSSRRIAEELKKRGNPKVNVFTRRALDDLVSVGDPKHNEVYFGFDAARVAKRDSLKRELDKAAPIKEYAKSVLNVSSAIKAREKSFYCSFHEYSNLTAIPKRRKKPRLVGIADFSLEDKAPYLDKVLNAGIYKDALAFIDENKGAIEPEVTWDPSRELPISHKELLMDLYAYCVLNGVKTCLLCGHRYRGANSLKKRMDQHFASLTFLDEGTAGQKAMGIAERIYASVREDQYLKAVFPIQERSPKKCFRDIRLYIKLCEYTLYYVGESLANTLVTEDKTVKELSDELEETERLIKSHASNLKHVRRYNLYLSREIKKIVDFPNEVTVEPLEKNFGLSFYLLGKKNDPLQFLSESELKRLALVALKAEVHFGKTNVLLLDDPVDSYDDYNKLVCIKYIASIAKMRAMKSLYILSNDFETVFRLSEECGKSVVFYLPDFDTSLGGSGLDNYLEIECDATEVKKASRNELAFFAEVTGERPTKPYNYEMMVLALSLSCRNISGELFRKLTRVKVEGGSGPSLTSSADWASDVTKYIVRSYEHYLPPFADAVFNSDTLTLGDICGCFSRELTN